MPSSSDPVDGIGAICTMEEVDRWLQRHAVALDHATATRFQETLSVVQLNLTPSRQQVRSLCRTWGIQQVVANKDVPNACLLQSLRTKVVDAANALREELGPEPKPWVGKAEPTHRIRGKRKADFELSSTMPLHDAAMFSAAQQPAGNVSSSSAGVSDSNIMRPTTPTFEKRTHDLDPSCGASMSSGALQPARDVPSSPVDVCDGDVMHRIDDVERWLERRASGSNDPEGGRIRETLAVLRTHPAPKKMHVRQLCRTWAVPQVVNYQDVPHSRLLEQIQTKVIREANSLREAQSTVPVPPTAKRKLINTSRKHKVDTEPADMDMCNSAQQPAGISSTAKAKLNNTLKKRKVDVVPASMGMCSSAQQPAGIAAYSSGNAGEVNAMRSLDDVDRWLQSHAGVADHPQEKLFRATLKVLQMVPQPTQEHVRPLCAPWEVQQIINGKYVKLAILIDQLKDKLLDVANQARGGLFTPKTLRVQEDMMNRLLTDL